EVRRIVSVIREYPDSLALRVRLLETYRRFGSVEGRRLAQKGYADLLKRYPDNTSLLLAYAELRLEQGFLKEAEGLFRRAVRKDPRSVDAQFGMAHLALHDYRRYLDPKCLRAAEGWLDRVLLVDPAHRDALFSRAFTYVVDKDSLSALQCADRLVAAHP